MCQCKTRLLPIHHLKPHRVAASAKQLVRAAVAKRSASPYPQSTEMPQWPRWIGFLMVGDDGVQSRYSGTQESRTKA